jgi:hypothetical protein
MRKAAVAVLLVVAASAVAVFAQTDRAAVEKQIIAGERKINEAFAKGDVAGFQALVASDGYSVDAMGRMKASEFPKVIKDMKIASWDIDQSQILWVNNDVAIHTYRWTGKGTFQGQPFPSPAWASTVWMKKDGKWIAFFHQESPAMEMPKPPAKK